MTLSSEFFNQSFSMALTALLMNGPPYELMRKTATWGETQRLEQS